MKKIFLLTTVLSLIVFTSCTTRVNQITQKSLLGWNDQDQRLHKGEIFNGILYENYDQGQLRYEYEVKNGLRNGFWREYDNAGFLKEEYFYVDEVIHGPITNWFENGQIMRSGEYTNGEKSGTWNYYDRDGSIKRTKEY